MSIIKKARDKTISVVAKLTNKLYERSLRKRLRNKDFTILCSNCIGGIIYHRLGKEFLSPTINLWLTQGDFIKFANGLEYYIALPLKFIESDMDYPVAMLDDITIHFNHSKTAESAASDWNKRKERINYDNIYIIMYYRDNYSLEEIRKIERAKCKRFIVLTNTKLDFGYAHYIKEMIGKPNAGSFLDEDILGMRTFEKKWDFVAWLNGE